MGQLSYVLKVIILFVIVIFILVGLLSLYYSLRVSFELTKVLFELPGFEQAVVFLFLVVLVKALFVFLLIKLFKYVERQLNETK